MLELGFPIKSFDVLALPDGMDRMGWDFGVFAESSDSQLVVEVAMFLNLTVQIMEPLPPQNIMEFVRVCSWGKITLENEEDDE